MDNQTEEEILQLIMKESKLEYCSADGNGLLCNNYGEFRLNCNHRVCIIHKEMNYCFACGALQEKCARKIQRWYKRAIMRRRVRELSEFAKTRRMRENWAADVIKGAIKIKIAKNKLRDLRRIQARESFLRRFEQRII